MILTVNVSNSNILLGAYQDDKQCFVPVCILIC